MADLIRHTTHRFTFTGSDRLRPENNKGRSADLPLRFESELGQLLHDAEQLDLEDERLVRADVAAGTVLTVGEVGRDEDFPFGADGHELQRLGPAFDDFLHAEALANAGDPVLSSCDG